MIEAGPAQGCRMKRRAASNDYASGAVEMPVQRCIASTIQPGHVFFDIGANVGFFSLVAASSSNRSCRIFAFEARRSAARMLRRNLRANGMHGAVWEVAVGDHEGEVDLMVGEHPGGATIARDVAEPGAKPLRVPSITIDAAIESGRLPDPDVVKIDVEGAELAVLRGMARTLRRARPVVVFEVDAPSSADAEQRYASVVSVLADSGYLCTRLEPSYQDTGWHVIHGWATAPPHVNG